MTCHDAQRALIDGLFDVADAARAGIDAHLSGCPACARVAAQQRRLDVTLTSALIPPRLSSTFRMSLTRKIEAPSRSFMSDALPDILHLASGVVLTSYLASATPFPAPMVAAVGTLVTAGSYFVLAMLRNSFDESAM